MINLIVDSSKTLTIKRDSEIFVGESEFDSIFVKVAPEVCNNNIRDFEVKLNIIDPDDKVDTKILTMAQDSDGFFVSQIQFSSKYSSLAGQYKMYIQMISKQGGRVGKTNTVYYIVNEITEDTGELIEGFESLITQYESQILNAVSTATFMGERITPTNIILFNEHNIPVEILDSVDTFSPGMEIIDGETVKSIFIPSSVKIFGGFYEGVGAENGITDIYIDNYESDVNVSGNIRGEIHYKDSFVFGQMLASAISYLYRNKVDKATTLNGYGITDVYTKTESDGKYEILSHKTNSISSSKQTTTADNENYPSVSGLKDFAFGNFYTQDEVDDEIENNRNSIFVYTLLKDSWSNGSQTVSAPVSYTVNANTRADIDIDSFVNNQMLQDDCAGLYITTEVVDNIPTLIAHYLGNKPSANLTVQIELSVVNTISGQ